MVMLPNPLNNDLLRHSINRAIVRANMARLRLRRNFAGSIRVNLLRLTKMGICAE